MVVLPLNLTRGGGCKSTSSQNKIFDLYYITKNVVRCHLSKRIVPLLYCEMCHKKLCKTCAVEHLLDVSNVLIVVLIKQYLR